MSKSRDIADSAATINYIDTVTSNVQDQIDNIDPLPSQTGNSGKYLTTDGSIASWAEVGGATDYQEFTSSGTWTKPAGINYVYIEAVAGGGGGSWSTGGRQQGGGGGEGVAKLLRASDLGSTETVTIGSGGAGGFDSGVTATENGQDGGDSSFGSHVIAKGGKGGSKALTSHEQYIINGFGNSGSGAKPIVNMDYTGDADSYGSSNYAGGAAGGGRNGIGGDAVLGGAGGAGILNSAVNSGGVSTFGGNGGDSNGAGNGGDGQVPGGGGGACYFFSQYTGGDGGNGRIRIWAW